MTIDAAKATLRDELQRRIRLSGGPEVFRRILRGHEDLADAAVAELVAEGLLKQTELRVGTIYHYPANAKSSLDYLTEQLERAADAPVRPARTVTHAAPAAARLAASAEPVAPATPATPSADPSPSAPPAAPTFTGPIKAQKRTSAAPVAAAAGASPALTGSPAAETQAPAAPVFTGPIKAKKRSQIAAEAAVAAEGAPIVPPAAESATPSTAAPEAAQPIVYTGPIKAKKRSQIAAEEAEAAGGGATTGSPASPTSAAAPIDSKEATGEVPPAPEMPVYTGPIKAKKRSES